jgi:hypothetical protein
MGDSAVAGTSLCEQAKRGNITHIIEGKRNATLKLAWHPWFTLL